MLQSQTSHLHDLIFATDQIAGQLVLQSVLLAFQLKTRKKTVRRRKHSNTKKKLKNTQRLDGNHTNHYDAFGVSHFMQMRQHNHMQSAWKRKKIEVDISMHNTIV